MDSASNPRRPRSRPASLGPPHARGGFLLLLALVVVACGDPGPAGPSDGSEPAAGETGVVVNSVDLTLTLFPVDAPGSTRTVELGPEGSPVSVATRGSIAVVPMGVVPTAQVVDLEAGEVVHSVSLPEGSGATGVAFVDDSTAVVGNPDRNSVSPVDVRSGTAGEEIPVGTFPQSIVAAGDRIFVLNAELGPDFEPEGPGTATVLSSSLSVVGTVELSGENPAGGAPGPDGRLYVVNSGRFGGGDGSLSVVDPGALEEVEHHDGFGEFPGPPVFRENGLLYVASFSYGVAVWDPTADAFARAPDDAVAPGGVPATSAVAVDGEGRLYATSPVCSEPTVVYRLTASFEVDVEIPVGSCPVAITFTAAGR